MFSARSLDGVKVKIVLLTSGVMVPVMPGVTVKVVMLIVEGSIACGKVTATKVLGHSPTEPLGGVSEMGGAGG